MNDDPYGNLLPSSSVLPLPLALLLFLLFFVLGALFAMCESAAETANESRIKKDAESGEPRAKKLLEYLERSAGIISPLQSGMMLMGFFALAVAVTGFAPRLYNVFIRAARFPRLPLPCFRRCFAHCCARSLSNGSRPRSEKFVAHRLHGMQHACKLCPMLCALSAVMHPFVLLCNFISDGLMRLLGNDPKALDETVTEEEILHMVGEGEEKGVIEENERDMITNIFDFNDTTVTEIMTHRTDICAIDEESTIAQAAVLAVENGFSRLPVYREDIDTIVGICYVKDFLPYVNQPVPDFIHLKDMVRPAYFIPETKRVQASSLKAQGAACRSPSSSMNTAARRVSSRRPHGSIFGNIQDEYDNEQEEIFRVSENEFTVDGTTSIDEFPTTDTELPEGDYDTIAGLVTDLLGRIPKENEHPSVQVCGLTITVLEIEDQRLSRLLIVKNDPRKTPEEETHETMFLKRRPMTFSEAFYGTYKIDKKDGKPHLKERIFAPVDGFWSGVMIFGGVVGTIILLLTFAAHVQVALGTFAPPGRKRRAHPMHSIRCGACSSRSSLRFSCSPFRAGSSAAAPCSSASSAHFSSCSRRSSSPRSA